MVLLIDPPAITAIEFTEVCTNDFTVSWSTASNEEGLSYTVTLSSPSMMNDIVVDAMMNTSYNFTDLTPTTAYDVSVVSRLISTCVGIPDTIMVTTLTVEEGVPQSELICYVREPLNYVFKDHLLIKNFLEVVRFLHYIDSIASEPCHVSHIKTRNAIIENWKNFNCFSQLV